MNGESYSAPEITELQTTEVKVDDAPTKAVKTVIAAVPETVDLTSNESFYREKVDNLFRYLEGKIGFSNDKERTTEMIGFMQQTGRMLKYDYVEAKSCILYLIQKMRNTPQAIEDGRFFRYLKGCENSYPQDAIAQYRIFATWCISIADSWPTRVKRAKSTDIESLTKSMPGAARDNLNFFVREMANYVIQ